MLKRPSLREKIFPHPVVSVIVACSWLMLANNLEATSLAMALLLALVLPYLVKPFIECTPSIRWSFAIKLFFVVFWDVIVSNFKVAKLVLGPMEQLSPKWFRVPLDTQHEQVNTLLAMIITTTPGTVSAGIDQDRGDILVHALSTEDIDAEIALIKQRYEQPLMQIFSVNIGENS